MVENINLYKLAMMFQVQKFKFSDIFGCKCNWKKEIIGSIHFELFKNLIKVREMYTLRSQIEGYTGLLIFRKFSTLPAVIWASPFINFQEIFQPPCFFTYKNEKFSTLPIRAYPLIKFEEKF